MLELKNNNWQVSKNEVFNSIVYPLAKAVHVLQLERANPGGRTRNRRPPPPAPGAWKIATLFVPMVVVVAPMFFVDGSVDDPSAEARDHLHLQRELRDGVLDSYFSIEFVQRTYLEDFLDQRVLPFCDQIVETMQSAGSLLAEAAVEDVRSRRESVLGQERDD